MRQELVWDVEATVHAQERNRSELFRVGDGRARSGSCQNVIVFVIGARLDGLRAKVSAGLGSLDRGEGVDGDAVVDEILSDEPHAG